MPLTDLGVVEADLIRFAPFSSSLHNGPSASALRRSGRDGSARFLKGADLPESDNTMELRWRVDLVPEASGLATVDLEKRIMSSLPHIAAIAYMVSGPRQPTNAGELMLRRQDAAPRHYWLRGWQSDLGGFTKLCEALCEIFKTAVSGRWTLL